IASVNAMARMPCTSTCVKAPGLRPTAVVIPKPVKPIPIPTPIAASPTWMLPPSSASIGSIIFFLVVLRSRHEIVEKSVRMLRSLLVLCNQHCENRSQQHENERLYKSNEHLQKIERNWQNWR